MVSDCLDGKIDLILTKSISRFARNLGEEGLFDLLTPLENRIDAPIVLENNVNLAALGERACIVVTDEYPTFFIPHMQRAAAAQLDVALERMDESALRDLQARLRQAREKNFSLLRRQGAARVEAEGGRGAAQAVSQARSAAWLATIWCTGQRSSRLCASVAP